MNKIQLTAFSIREAYVQLVPLFSWFGSHSAARSASSKPGAEHGLGAHLCCSKARLSSCLSSLFQAFLFPKLLDREFTRFEFPRRLKGDDVGQKVLYRDYFMEGW